MYFYFFVNTSALDQSALEAFVAGKVSNQRFVNSRLANSRSVKLKYTLLYAKKTSSALNECLLVTDINA